ncbi:MAG: pitrilysin family protein [Bacteroidales bacterium]|nr:pitrilysin family protein [Bacteroidales bacterium]
MTDWSKQPEISTFKNVELKYPQPVTLSNGIPVWVVGDGDDEVNRIELFMGGGVCEEPKPLLSYLAALLSLEGSQKMSAAEIAEAMDFYGSLKSAQPADHCAQFSLSSLNRNFASTAPILADCIASPLYSEQECMLYQQRIASNVATARQRVEYMAQEEMMRLYYGEGHPYAKEPSPEVLMGITTDDYKAFHATYYNASNVRIVFSGKVTDKEMAVLDSTIGAWHHFGEKVDPSIEPEIRPSEKMLSIVDKKDALQSAVAITLRCIPRRHPDYFKLRLLITALGGYFGSRLNMNIREEKGYTYGIHSYLAGKAHDSYACVMSSCATEHTWALISEVKKEMARLREEPMPDDELRTVKQHMLSDLMKTLDTPFSIARYVGDCFTVGIYPEYFNEQVAAILACTPADVQEVANRYLLEEKMRIVIAGDKQKLQELGEK